MIPKIIHYCWFSNDRKPKTIQRCIDSWKQNMPQYQIRCWDRNSFDFETIRFTKEAISVKQYAAAADYIRLFALYSEGGIYLDSDVLIKKSFDDFLSQDFFSGTEAFFINGDKHYRIEAAIMGAEKGNQFVKECMSYYEESSFIKDDGSYDNKRVVMPQVISKYAERYGYQYKDEFQQLSNGSVVFPTSTFSNTLCYNESFEKQLYAVHQNAGSWIDYSNRGFFFRLCRKYDQMNFYRFVEKIRLYK